MDTDKLYARLTMPAPSWVVGLLGLLVLGGGYYVHQRVGLRTQEFHTTLNALMDARDQSEIAAQHFRTLADLKAQDVEQFKSGMATVAQMRKTLYEAGLASQEERRLLEKQWEIMITYLTVNSELQRIFLMRGDQPLESHLIGYVPIKAMGGLPATVPRTVRIISKERFAHPERGKAEMVDGKLQWEPPQVGTSVRANALGEYVLFTNRHLILHGPPKNPIDHEAFPHLCLGLSLSAARSLYQQSFIGSKILLTSVKEELDRQNASGLTVTVDTSAAQPSPNAR
jgi:hypothetical protein